MNAPDRVSGRVVGRNRWNSIEFKLPLLMTAVLAIVKTITLIVTYETLTRSAINIATERLERATHQLATLGAQGIVAARPRYTLAANDSAIRGVLGTTGANGAIKPRTDRQTLRAARAALEKLVQPTDSGMPVELWNANGQRITYVGDDIRGPLLQGTGRGELQQSTDPVFLAGKTATDSLTLGPLYLQEDRVHFWMVMPVMENGAPIGFIAHQRRINRNPQVERTLRDLSGDSVSMYYRSLDGNVWATISGLPVSARPASAPERLGAQSDLLFKEERIAGTPLVVWMDIPRSAVLASSRSIIRKLALVGLLLLIGGTLASWAIGRRIARPLGAITEAAGDIADGHYAARVPERGEDEVRRLAKSFNNMAAEIELSRGALEQQTREARSANNAKSEFLTIMSHELRTPLNAIGGYAELLEMGLRGPITDAQRRDLERIKASQQHLLGLISGVLDLSRIESGRVTYASESIALEPFLSGLDALVAPQAAAKSLTLECRPCGSRLAALGDREKLRQVLLNLLSNAIRHTPAHGNITVSAVEEPDRIVIAVQDTGPGISEERHEHIFEPFVQLDRSLTKTREGLGLWLAISRDLARGMGGDLTVESSAGDGARFILTLPRADYVPENAYLRSGEMRIVR